MAVILLPASAACRYGWFLSSTRVGASPDFQAQTRPSLPVSMAWLPLAVILLAFRLSGRPTAVMLVVLSARYRACPFESKRRNPLLRAWAWTVRVSGSCLMRSGLAFPVLPVSQVQACPSVSKARIRLADATAVTACAFPDRLVVSCSSGFGFRFWLPWKL